MTADPATHPQTTLLFPGQGAQDLHLLTGVKHMADFRQRYELACAALQSDPLAEIEQGNQTYLNQNRVSSILVLLVSSLLLDRYTETTETPPAFLAGYSVGQWLALYAAQVITFEQLLTIVNTRAGFMDACFQEQQGGMLAVIGLAADRLEQLCSEFNAAGHYLTISNYNCVGQFSLAGTLEAIELAYERLQALKPKKVVRLPVSGAWHCALLNQAADLFGAYLQDIPFKPATLPIINNVTGDLLPMTEPDLKEQLAAHLTAPVRWDTGIKTLIAQGSQEFVEIGYGNTLTKFGFFIDRSVKHWAFGVRPGS